VQSIFLTVFFPSFGFEAFGFFPLPVALNPSSPVLPNGD
jgi:hypothetical protein